MNFVKDIPRPSSNCVPVARFLGGKNPKGIPDDSPGFLNHGTNKPEGLVDRASGVFPPIRYATPFELANCHGHIPGVQEPRASLRNPFGIGELTQT